VICGGSPLPCTSPRGKTDRLVLVGGARHHVREDVWFGGGAAAFCKAAAATVRLGCGSEPLGSSASVATCQVVPRWRLGQPDSFLEGRRPRWLPEIPGAPGRVSSSSLTQVWIRQASLLEGRGTLPSSLREWQRWWPSDRLGWSAGLAAQTQGRWADGTRGTDDLAHMRCDPNQPDASLA